MENIEKFRAYASDWLEEHCPQTMRSPMPDDERIWGGRNPVFKNPDSKIWLERMVAQGWTTPTWPVKYGGAGLSSKEASVLQGEMSSLGCRTPLSSFGIGMLGPVLLKYGTDDQKMVHLPPISRGEIRWCQGYSEPGAGSDLASLQTKADRRNAEFVVNGQKIWTSYADKADWIFCLVRTDNTKKHEGISFLLVDMASAGVVTRPIELISGASVFCETFFTDVSVPENNLVGGLNQGWTIAKELLIHERGLIAHIGKITGSAVPPLEDYAHRYLGENEGRISNYVLRDQLAKHLIDDRAFSLTVRRASELNKEGTAAGHLASMFKYYGSEQNKRKFELILKILGLTGLGWDGSEFETSEIAACRTWLRSKGNSIEGGTSEVQLNVISKRVLGLPD